MGAGRRGPDRVAAAQIVQNSHRIALPDDQPPAHAAQRGIQRLQAAGIAAALFIDPDVDQIHASAEAGAHHIELHTGAYADAADSTTRRAELARIVEAAELAESLGIEVHAGHGLHVDNVGEISAIAPIVELNIGHALIARAVFVGLGEAIVELSAAMAAGRRQIV